MELSRKALKIVTSAFDDLGVPYLRPDAGLFVYTDLRKVCCCYCCSSGLFVYTDLRLFIVFAVYVVVVDVQIVGLMRDIVLTILSCI